MRIFMNFSPGTSKCAYVFNLEDWWVKIYIWKNTDGIPDTDIRWGMLFYGEIHHDSS